MSHKKLLFVLLLAAASAARAQAPDGWYLGADFWTYFDNMEASPCEKDYSGTLFGVRLTPYAGFQWGNSNRLSFGVDMRQDFGDDVKFLTDVKPVIYYTLQAEHWKAMAGVFPRKELIGEYGEAVFRNEYYYTDDLLPGVAVSYKSNRALWEAALSWDGMYSKTRREKFKLFSTAKYHVHPNLYLGYNLCMTHLAHSASGKLTEGVVDVMFVNPFVGTDFNAFFDFDLRAHLMFSSQRDRIMKQSRRPIGGQADVSLSKWGLRLHNETYFGGNQLPFYAKYGELLYSASEFYGTRRRIYNHTGLDYRRTFFKGTLDVMASVEAHYDGTGVGLQQMLSVKVNLEKHWKFKR